MSAVARGAGARRRRAHPDILEAVRHLRPSSDGLAAVWLKHDTPAADHVRAEEAAVFPEVPELLSDDVEKQCMFVVVVDVELGQLLHCLRVSGPFIRRANGDGAHSSGFVIVDELIAESDSFTVEDFLRRYPTSTLDISLSLETNFRIGERRELRSGVRVAHLAYLSLFRCVERLRPEGEEALVFGAQNEATVQSLAAIGLPSTPLAVLPEQRNESDDVYRPKVISVTDRTRAVFEALDSLALPEAWLGDASWARDALGLPQVGAQRGHSESRQMYGAPA